VSKDTSIFFLLTTEGVRASQGAHIHVRPIRGDGQRPFVLIFFPPQWNLL